MGSRTVRLDDKTEKVLQEIVRKTGLSISDTFKKGILALRDAISDQPLQSSYDVIRNWISGLADIRKLSRHRHAKGYKTPSSESINDDHRRHGSV